MPTTSDYLTQLQQDREDLVDNLEAKGITGLTGDETFTELIPEILNIPSGGSPEEYFRNEITNNPTSTVRGLDYLIKKIPAFTITSQVTSLQYCFKSCRALEIDVSQLNTENITVMRNMFEDCRNLTNLDLSNFNTSRVTDMRYMFSGCYNLTNLDIRNFVFTTVNNYTDMFGSEGAGVPNDCQIIVADDTAKTWITSKWSRFTNVKTIAEL